MHKGSLFILDSYHYRYNCQRHLTVFFTLGHKSLSVQGLQGEPRTHCTSSVFHPKQNALGSSLSHLQEVPRVPPALTYLMVRRKERYHFHPKVVAPTGFSLNLVSLQCGKDFLGLCICHFLTRAAIRVIWSQVPVQGLASVTSWAFNICPTCTGALEKWRRKEQVRIYVTVAEHSACYPRVSNGCF